MTRSAIVIDTTPQATAESIRRVHAWLLYHDTNTITIAGARTLIDEFNRRWPEYKTIVVDTISKQKADE